MALTADQKQHIKDSTLLYRSEINQINDWIYNEPSDERCELLYLLRAISTIEHGARIDLFNENHSEASLEEIAQQVNRYFPEKDDGELFDDLSILEDEVRERYFNDPQTEKKALLTQLGLKF